MNSETLSKSPKNVTEALVVHCIDFRFQAYLDTWLQENLGFGNYDRVALAGGVYDFKAIFAQLRISVELHEIKRVVLINHEDCGMYGAEGTLERHKSDLENVKREIDSLFPDLEVERYYLRLNGTFERV